MDTKAKQFLTQFSATLFQQWTETQEKELFWMNERFLHDLLEEAVAKLPKISLKGHLTRELNGYCAELKRLLQELYASYEQERQQQQLSSTKGGAYSHELLNEDDIERALVAPSTQVLELLALDKLESTTADPAKRTKDEIIAAVECDAAQWQQVAVRGYETPDEQLHKRGFYLQRLAQSIEQLLKMYAEEHNRNWNCTSNEHAEELQRVRGVLQRIIALDVISNVRTTYTTQVTEPSSPWTAFYQPQESAMLRKIDHDAQMAKIYGNLLVLAIYFPIQYEDEDDTTSDESTSESSSDSEEEQHEDLIEKKVKKQQKPLDVVQQAKHTLRQVVFAASKRSNKAAWLRQVLMSVHHLPKPDSYFDEDKDEVLETEEKQALRDCLSDIYRRGFTDATLFDQTREDSEDWELFQNVVCLRHAVDFMRFHKIQTTLPVLMTVMAQLVRVPLPQSFWQWLTDAKRLYATQPVAIQHVTKKLMKNKSAKMADVLLRESEVTMEELLAMEESYKVYLQNQKSDQLSLLGRSVEIIESNTTSSITHKEPEVAEEVDASLFFVDNAGGAAKQKSKNKKRKKSNAGNTASATTKQKTAIA